MTPTTAKKTASSRKSPQTLKSINPRTGQVREEIPAIAPGEVRDYVEQARKVAPEWGSLPVEARARYMRQVRYRMYELMDEIVEVVHEECGKPRTEALVHEMLPPMLSIAWFERQAPKILRTTRTGKIIGPLLGSASRIEWRPYGVVGCITPWNFPLSNAFLAFTGALFAGNAVVIKPSEVTPAAGELLRKILDPLPAGVATVIQGGGEVGAALVDAPCDKISFIGSPRTGRLICEAAAKHLTPVVMELGGNDAAIVCDDIDVDYASSGVLWGAFANAGQICASIERVYVMDRIADEFEDQLLSKLQRLREGEDVGSLTFKPQLDVVRKHLDDAQEHGGALQSAEGGYAAENGSLWHAPTVVTNVNDEMTVLHEETFGPVLSVVRVRDENEALRRANEDGVNLTASVWTRDAARRGRLASQLKAGTITVNMHVEGAATPWGTWGGVGESGFGRLQGDPGLKEFVVPVHVARPTMPTKRIWWYPYDEANEAVLGGVIRFLGERSIGDKVAAAKDVAGNFAKLLKSRL